MKRVVVTLVVASMLVGCASTPGEAPITWERFAATPGGNWSDSELCRAWVHANDTDQAAYEEAAYAVASSRGLTFSQCVATAKRGDQFASTAAKVLVGVAIAALAYAVVRRGGGGGGVPAQGDYSYSWDLFYNEYRQLVWACRGEQTGQFADQTNCQFKAKNDLRWPSLEAPR